jgi:hypothetical protein
MKTTCAPAPPAVINRLSLARHWQPSASGKPDPESVGVLTPEGVEPIAE